MKLRRKSPAATPRQRRGSLPSSAGSKFSYSANRAQTDQNTGRQTGKINIEAAKQTAKNAKHFWLQRFGLLILLAAGLFSAVNVVSLSADSKVMPLTHDQNASLLRDEADYKLVADQLLGDSIWNKNKITVNTSEVSRQLLKDFPELSSASVTIPMLSHRPLVYVESGQPAIILTNNKGAFLLDIDGKALMRAGSAEELNQPDLPVVSDQSGLQIKLNRQALPAPDVAFMSNVNKQLAARQFKVTAMTLPAGSQEVNVNLEGKPYIVRFNLHTTQKAREQAGTFIVTANQLQKQNITPSQYIDVRVDGRAYYK